VPVVGPGEGMAAIQAEGNPNIKYTGYRGADHDVSDRTDDSAQVIKWPLAQKR
jgi:hypothetical protein